MSYIISPIQEQKVTYELQRWSEDWNEWVSTQARHAPLDAFLDKDELEAAYKCKTRVIQRTESIALVVREVDIE